MSDAKTWAGKTLEEEIARLILLHGKSEFRETAKRLAKGEAGPKTIDDWPLLEPYYRKDARDWLDGNKLRSTKAVADKIGQSLGENLEGKDRIYRRMLMGRTRSYLFQAYLISGSEYPVRRHLDAIRALIAETKWPVWTDVGARVMFDVETFTDRGGILTDEMSLEEIQAANGEQAPIVGPPSKNGLFEPD